MKFLLVFLLVILLGLFHAHASEDEFEVLSDLAEFGTEGDASEPAVLIEVDHDEALELDVDDEMEEEADEEGEVSETADTLAANEADLEADVSAYADTHAADEADASLLEVSAPDDLAMIYPGYKITRWYKPASGDHFYTKSPTGEIAPQIGYRGEGMPFVTVADTAPGSVPFYRYLNRNNGEHFYTQSSTAENHLHVYTPEGTIGNVFPTQQPHTVPLYRCYNGGNGDHFYCLHPNCENARPAYTPEGIAGYVYPPDIVFPAAPPLPEERPVFIQAGPKVYRWYNPSSKDTFLCNDPKGEIAGQIGYKQESDPLFTAVKESAPGAIPLYRFLGNGQHFYTIKKDAEGISGYNLEGVIGGIYPFRATATVPLHRCHDMANNRYFYTLDGQCEGRAGYVYQVMLGYVFPAQFDEAAVQKERFPVDETERAYPYKLHHRCTDLRTHYRLFPTEQRECDNNYHFEGPHFIDVSSRAPDAVRLYKYKNKATGNLLYTRSMNAEGHQNSFEAQGDVGYVFATMRLHTIPLYRCYSNEKQAHLMTTHPNCDNLVPQYRFEGVVAWAYNTTIKRESAEDGVAAVAPLAMDKKVFRWYKPSSGAYFLTAHPRGEIAAQVGYRFQEMSFITANATNATVPLHRFYGKGMHLYSTDRNAERQQGFRYEGVLGDIYPSKVTATVALHRCYNEKTQRYLYTLSKICEELPGFDYDLRLGYVYPPKMDLQVVENQVGLASTNNVYPPANGNSVGSFNPAKDFPSSQLDNLRSLVNSTGNAAPVNATAAPVSNDSGATLIAQKNGIDITNGFFTYPNGTSVALGNGTVTVVNAEAPNPNHPHGCYNNATFAANTCLCLPQFTGKWCQLMSPTYRPRERQSHVLGNLTTLIESVNHRLSDLENAAGRMEDIERIIETTAKDKVATLHVKFVRNTFHEALSRNDLLTAKTQLGLIKHLDVKLYVELSRELAIHEDKMNTEFSQMRPVIQKMAVPVMRNFMYDHVETKKAPFTGLRALRLAEDAIQKADTRRHEFNLVYADQV